MNINIIGLIIGILCGLPYLGIMFRNKATPSFHHFAEIILACIGIIAFSKFGIDVALSDDSYLGKIADQRITIVIGAIALIWMSINAIIQIYAPLLHKNEKPTIATPEKIDTKQDSTT